MVKNCKFCRRFVSKNKKHICPIKLIKRLRRNTIYVKKSKYDQFYTSPEIAKFCFNLLLETVNIKNFDICLEPSAGNGSFFNLLPEDKKIGIDIDPKSSDIKKIDFFEYLPPIDKKIITIGNPPFGKNSSLAIRFFNKSSEFSDVIAFVLPKTFNKLSIQNKLNRFFHLKKTVDLPKNSFIFDGERYNVPSVFQILVRSKFKRKISIIKIENNLFSFCKKNESDFAIRRVGGRAGKATKYISNLSESSHYFIKLINKNTDIDDVINIINNIDFSATSACTSGVKSLSKPELIKYLMESRLSKFMK